MRYPDPSGFADALDTMDKKLLHDIIVYFDYIDVSLYDAYYNGAFNQHDMSDAERRLAIDIEYRKIATFSQLLDVIEAI